VHALPFGARARMLVLTMPLENCQFSHGTGWKLVARPDGHGKFAVACDCSTDERATLTMDRARIPKRYEHCDFESYVTDLADGKSVDHATRAIAEARQDEHPRFLFVSIPGPRKRRLAGC
jgi:hypothetical protein